MKYASVDPTSGRVLCEFETLTDAELEGALALADAAYQQWSTTSLDERVAVLLRMAQMLRDHEVEITKLMTLEMGKPISEARMELGLCASIFEYYAQNGAKLLADETLDIAGAPGSAVVRTLPIGPILGVMPWNFPVYQVTRFIAPNLLLGNTILLKHSEICPQQALRLADLFADAGLPRGAYINLFASVEQIAAVIADPRVQGVSLTGSERAGRAIGAVAGQHLKKCVLELGGSDPFIVLPDADIEEAATAAFLGRFRNAGQVCSSSKRLIVHESVWDPFVEKFLAKVAELVPGDPSSDDTRMGPLSSVRAREGLAAQVDDAVARGAVVHLGAQVPEGEGAWYPPTVLSGVTPGMRAFHEELFGPVAVLYRVSSVDEAVELANDSPYGLGAAVFGTDLAAAEQVADRLEVGMVGLNTTIKSAPYLPFGGVKSSGIGRELGRYGIDEFANKKLIRVI